MCDTPKNPSHRRLIRLYKLSAIVCVLGYFTCFYGLRPTTGPLSFVLAGIAGVFYFGLFVSFALIVVRRFDEFQRILLARSFIWATVMTMGLSTVWGFIELGDHNRTPRFPVVFLPIVLLCTTAAAKVFIFRQHRSPSE